MQKNEMSVRWRFLEEELDPCGVVSREMEVHYLNAAGRALVPVHWFGRRCWQVFPVGEEGCASRCPAVQAVRNSSEIVYCQEHLYPGGGTSLKLGIAVIPLEKPRKDGERAILLFRSKDTEVSEDAFRGTLLKDAENLRARSLRHFQQGTVD